MYTYSYRQPQSHRWFIIEWQNFSWQHAVNVNTNLDCFAYTYLSKLLTSIILKLWPDLRKPDFDAQKSKSVFLVQDVWYDVMDWLMKFGFDSNSFSRDISRKPYNTLLKDLFWPFPCNNTRTNCWQTILQIVLHYTVIIIDIMRVFIVVVVHEQQRIRTVAIVGCSGVEQY